MTTLLSAYTRLQPVEKLGDFQVDRKTKINDMTGRLGNILSCMNLQVIITTQDDAYESKELSSHDVIETNKKRSERSFATARKYVIKCSLASL